MTPKSRTELIDALLDGEISDADFLRIEAELTVDPEVRKEYYDRLKLELLLEREARESDEPPASHESHTDLSVGRSNGLTLAAGILIAMAAAIVIVVMLWPTDSNPLLDPPTVAQNEIEPTAVGFALLGGQSDAVWDGHQIGNGSLLPAGELHLKSGMAHLELFSGVQLVIQGDAIFSIDSAMEVRLIKGRASAHVPDAAHGFRVKTNQGDVVDLGTEFSLEVDDSSSRVDVVSGEIELHPRDSDSRKMAEGESIELSHGQASNTHFDRLDLISPAAFKRELSSRNTDRFNQWLDHSELLAHDDRLVAYYRIDSKDPTSRSIPNLATANESTAGQGAIVACERTRNRWGHADSALDFSRMGSRVRVNVPGEYRGVTMMCWVKINSLDRWFNSLFLTDGHELQEPHWQIMDDGRLFFSVKKYDINGLSADGTEDRESKFDSYSSVFWNSSLSGKWIMLATVYDVDSKRVTHYVNGKLIGSQQVPDEFLVEKVKIGPASIANWNEPMYRTDPQFVVRNLNGSMDEFALYSGALTSDEIAEHYRVGNPN